MNLIFLMFIEVHTTLGPKQSLHELLRGLFTFHATQCSLHFDKLQKNEIHSLTLLQSEKPKLYAILAFLSAIGLIVSLPVNYH